MPRIPLPRPETMTEEQRKVYDEVVRGPRGAMQGPLLAALYRPELADAWQKFGAILRYETSLPPRHSEMAILVTACATRCALEWYLHEPVALRAGLQPEFVDAIREGREPRFAEPLDASIHRFTRQLHETHSVASSTYQEVMDVYGALGVVELTALVGYYTMVAMTLNAHEYSLPDGADAILF